jgi:hypothetical protein
MTGPAQNTEATKPTSSHSTPYDFRGSHSARGGGVPSLDEAELSVVRRETNRY